MKRPWMPWYVADFVADTLHLSAAQTGAYMLLIGHYWQHGELPIDDQAMCRITRMSTTEWQKSKPVIAAFFSAEWRHNRIDSELAKVAEISSKRRASAEQRHSKSNANAEHLDTHARATSPSQSQPQKKEPSLRSGRATPFPDGDWLTDEDREYATARGMGPVIATEFEKFRDHALAKGRTAKDWHAAWRNWITSPYQQTIKSGVKNGERNPTMAACDDLIDRAGRGAFEEGDDARDITPSRA